MDWSPVGCCRCKAMDGANVSGEEMLHHVSIQATVVESLISNYDELFCGEVFYRSSDGEWPFDRVSTLCKLFRKPTESNLNFLSVWCRWKMFPNIRCIKSPEIWVEVKRTRSQHIFWTEKLLHFGICCTHMSPSHTQFAFCPVHGPHTIRSIPLPDCQRIPLKTTVNSWPHRSSLHHLLRVNPSHYRMREHLFPFLYGLLLCAYVSFQPLCHPNQLLHLSLCSGWPPCTWILWEILIDPNLLKGSP